MAPGARGACRPLVGDGFALWFLVANWLIVLALVWPVGRVAPPRTRPASIAISVGLLPALVLLAFKGDCWLITGGLAWLTITVADRREVTRVPINPDAAG